MAKNAKITKPGENSNFMQACNLAGASRFHRIEGLDKRYYANHANQGHHLERNFLGTIALSLQKGEDLLNAKFEGHTERHPDRA